MEGYQPSLTFTCTSPTRTTYAPTNKVHTAGFTYTSAKTRNMPFIPTGKKYDDTKKPAESCFPMAGPKHSH